MLKEEFVNVKFNVNLTHSITRLGDLVISGCCIVSGSNSLSLSMLLLFVFFVGVLCDDAIYYYVDL